MNTFAQSGNARLIEELATGKAKVIDLTHALSPSTPTFGGEKEPMHYKKLSFMEKDGYASGRFDMPEHFGTHADASAHVLAGGETIDQLDPNHLILSAVVIDVQKKVETNPDYQLTRRDIFTWEKDNIIPDRCAVILFTGWSSRFSDSEKYRNADSKGILHFPGYSIEAAKFLVNKRNIAALGTDTLSIDPGNSTDYPVHKFVLGHHLYMMEALANLDKLPARDILLFCGPLKIQGGTGSPARILAVIPYSSGRPS